MRQKNNKNIETKLSLKDLIDLKECQKIQNNFSAVTDIAIRMVNAEGNFVTSASGEPRLCSQVLEESGQKEIICGNCLPAFLGGKGIVDKNLSFICRAGLHNFLVPLRLNENRVLGYIILGPVILVMRKEKEGYQRVAEELNLDLEEFWSAILEIKVVSLHGIKSLIELIGDVCGYTITLAYKSRVRAREVIMPLDSSRLNRLFDVLLDVAFEVSQADIGSVMFFDKKQENLTIQASRGIPEEIARNVRVRLGEGISGIAAKEGKSLLLDDNIKDNRIKSYFNRPYISSSMVLPIKVENRVVGVVNLGTLKTSQVRFNVDNVGVMNKLLDLVTVAISPTK